MEQGKFEPTEEGSAQGSVMSPMLANIYMHHVLTLWFKLVVQREMQGECFLVNFADDFVAGFQYKSEAERYYKELKERMEKFGLELESSKSRLIEFGRFAEQNRRARGECKPETFDFLGFTFYCSKTRKGGFVPKVQTSRKKFEQKVRAYKNWIYDNRNRPMREIIKELNVKLIGHYRYYGVTWNFRKITTFLHRVQQFLFKAMNRRGCRRAYTWNGFVEMLKYYPLAKPKTWCQNPQKARVEIVLDSTASPYSETRGIISVGYKNHFIFVPEDLWNEEDEEDSEDEIADEEEFTKTSKKDKVETVEICKDLGNNFVLIKLF